MCIMTDIVNREERRCDKKRHDTCDIDIDVVACNRYSCVKAI